MRTPVSGGPCPNGPHQPTRPMHLNTNVRTPRPRKRRTSMSTATTATTAASYTIDPAHSGAGFKIRHLMIAYIRGGFSGLTGDVIVDPSNPANTKIDAAINAT